MKRTLVFVVALLVILAGVALLFPSEKNPFHIAKFFGADGRMYDGKSVRHWRGELKSADKDARLSALSALGAIGPDADDAVAEIGHLLTDDPDPEVREWASLALAKMAPHTKAVLPAMIQAISDKNLTIRANTIHAVARLKTDGRPAIPALIAAMRDPVNDTTAGLFHHTIQEGAASVLGVVSKDTAEAVPALTAALTEDTSDRVKTAAARSLGQIGDPAKGTIPKLYELLKHKNRFIREESNIALRALGEKIEPFEPTPEDLKMNMNGDPRGGGGKGGPGGPPKGKGPKP